MKGVCDGVSFVDSTYLKVCHIKRMSNHKVFKDVARIGKSSMGWFYGFKLHLMVSSKGEILNFCITPGHENDRVPVEKLCQNLWGKVFGDKGYISIDLFKKIFFERGVQIITPLKKKMKPQILSQEDSHHLSKRSRIECVFNVLKNSLKIDHTRHRSIKNFMVNIISGICAYGMRFANPKLKVCS